MTRICPQCGNQNDEDKRFCTTCGHALVSVPDQSGEPAREPAAAVAGSAPPAPDNLKIVALAAVAILIILAALYFLQISGTVTILPFLSPAVSPPPTITPPVTSSIIVDTPLPETIAPVTEVSLNMTNVTESPASLPVTIKPLVCPADRRTCGANCTDTLTDRYNCGTCNVTCGFMETCQGGHCLTPCADTESSCPDGCHNLSYDTLNCGTCGNSCPVGLVCNRSVCTPPQKTVIPTYLG